MSWLVENWKELLEAVLAVVGAASVIVKLTPTPKDDAVVAKIMKFFNWISLAKKVK